MSRAALATRIGGAVQCTRCSSSSPCTTPAAAAQRANITLRQHGATVVRVPSSTAENGTGTKRRRQNWPKAPLFARICTSAGQSHVAAPARLPRNTHGRETASVVPRRLTEPSSGFVSCREDRWGPTRDPTEQVGEVLVAPNAMLRHVARHQRISTCAGANREYTPSR